tara:strand:- start:415 stop:951 length:537 start_codon:yes stop_codon:yes gene_type:complete
MYFSQARTYYIRIKYNGVLVTNERTLSQSGSSVTGASIRGPAYSTLTTFTDSTASTHSTSTPNILKTTPYNGSHVQHITNAIGLGNKVLYDLVSNTSAEIIDQSTLDSDGIPLSMDAYINLNQSVTFKKKMSIQIKIKDTDYTNDYPTAINFGINDSSKIGNYAYLMLIFIDNEWKWK